MIDITNFTNEQLNELSSLITKEFNSRRVECKHDRITFEYDSDTGNYCKGDDSYWVDVACLDCGDRQTYYDYDEGYKLENVGKLLKCTHEEYATLSKFGKG